MSIRRYFQDLIIARAYRILERQAAHDWRGVQLRPRIPFRPDFTGYPYEKVYPELQVGKGELGFIVREQYELDHADSRLKRLVIRVRRWHISKMSQERQLAYLRAQISWPPMLNVKSSIKRNDPEPQCDADDPEPYGDAIEPGPGMIQTIEGPPEVQA